MIKNASLFCVGLFVSFSLLMANPDDPEKNLLSIYPKNPPRSTACSWLKKSAWKIGEYALVYITLRGSEELLRHMGYSFFQNSPAPQAEPFTRRTYVMEFESPFDCQFQDSTLFAIFSNVTEHLMQFFCNSTTLAPTHSTNSTNVAVQDDRWDWDIPFDRSF